MAYAGIVPSESSSADSQHRGPITKTGNRLLRHVLGEAAHHARHTPRVTSKVKQRQTDVPPELIQLAWRAQVRLHTRYRHLSARIGALKALTAIARELAGFIWAAGHLVEEVPAAA
jgi:transposase